MLPRDTIPHSDCLATTLLPVTFPEPTPLEGSVQLYLVQIDLISLPHASTTPKTAGLGLSSEMDWAEEILGFPHSVMQNISGLGSTNTREVDCIEKATLSASGG